MAETSYNLISAEIDEWLELHKGESFNLDLICRQLNIVHSQSRKYASVKLSNEVKAHKLNKSNNIYSYIDNTLVIRNDWVNLSAAEPVELYLPMGDDESRFGFDGHIDIPERGLIIIAGVTNTGKSCWCRNLLWMNMNGSKHVTYFSSETSPEDFADYASRMTWANPLKENGEPVFDFVERWKDFQDVIRPDDINIIDWLNLGDNFYQIGEILQKIKNQLKTGIVVVAIQKGESNELGMGGQWGEHLSSLYLTMNYGRLTVKKAKKWREFNPNGLTWGFDIVDRGVHFHRIRELKKCGFCQNGKSKGQDCLKCSGTGWVDKEEF